MEQLYFFIPTVFWGFFAIMNPIANVPVFIGLTQNLEQKGKFQVAVKSLLIAFIMIVIFVVSGNAIFDLFGITIPAFQVAGGLLLFVVGFNMLHEQKSGVVHQKGEKALAQTQRHIDNANTAVAISPLAVPILAGPGTIATAVNFTTLQPDLPMYGKEVVIIGGFFAVCLITFVMFIASSKIEKFLGHGLITVISKIMGLILAVIGTQMVVTGVETLIKNFS